MTIRDMCDRVMTLNDMPFGEFLRGKLSVPAKGTECFSKGNTLKSLSLLIVMMVVGAIGDIIFETTK